MSSLLSIIEAILRYIQNKINNMLSKTSSLTGQMTQTGVKHNNRSGRAISIQKVDMMEGAQFEEFSRRLFIALGWLGVSKTPLSGDYGADLVLWDGQSRWVVQCKRYKSNVGNDAVQQAFAAIPVYKANRAAILTNSYFTKAAKNQAMVTGVVLWDRDNLIQMIDQANHKIHM